MLAQREACTGCSARAASVLFVALIAQAGLSGVQSGRNVSTERGTTAPGAQWTLTLPHTRTQIGSEL